MSNEVSLVTISDNVDEIIFFQRRKIAQALEEVALTAEGYAVRSCRRIVYQVPPSPHYQRTGNLLQSISHAVDGKYAVIGTNVEYAPYVHNGTRRTVPKPFLKHAIERHVPVYKEIVKRNLHG